jgi:hypothetical protein
MPGLARPPRSAALTFAAVLSLLLPIGCGTDTPPPVNLNEAEFKDIKKSREDVLKKEYIPSNTPEPKQFPK